MKGPELLGVISLLILSAVLVSDAVTLPSSVVLVLTSPITKVILLVLVVVAFMKSPPLGIAATVALAVILFSRNRQLVSSGGSLYTEWLQSLLGIRSDAQQEEPSVPTPDAFPLDEARPEGIPEVRTFSYRPMDETGSDEFVRSGPQMDEKLAVLA
jgi:hypothetical protein